MKMLDRFFAGLLLFGAAGHTAGTLAFYTWPSEIFVWSLGASLAAFLLGAINLLRANRLNDPALARRTCAIGSLAWLGLAMAFGVVIGNIADPRVLIHAIAAAGLTAFSMRSLMQEAS
jgi:hypothetical protein